MKKLKNIALTALFLGIIICIPQYAHAQKTSGAELIMEEIGADLPDEWNTWNRTKKFNFLESIGIYPNEKTGKYQGDAGDLTEYFALLKLEEPSDWNTMTFSKKQSYISQSSNTEMLKKILTNPETSQTIPQTSSTNTNTQNTTQTTKETQNPHSEKENKEEKGEDDDDIRVIIVSAIFLILLIPSMKYRNISSKIIYYGSPIVIGGISIFFATKDTFNLIGTLSKYLIIFILFVKPIAVLTKFKILNRIVGFRRQLGMLSFWLFLSHFLGLAYTLNLLSIEDYKPLYLIYGLIAALCMFIAGLTSNNYAIKYFKKHWKTLQYSVYIAFFALLAHTSMVEHKDLSELYLLGALFIALKIAEWYKKNAEKKTRLQK